jgi:CBS domain-containing protein
MRIKEIMQQHLATARQTDDLATAVQIMLWAGVRHLPVVEDGKLVGLLSERDVLWASAEAEDDKSAQSVGEAMSTPVETASPNDSVTTVAARMAKDRLGCMPLVEAGRLVGIVTTTDLLRAQARQAFDVDVAKPSEPYVQAADIMSKELVTISGDDALADAVARMQHHRVRHLPVVDGDRRLVGILSDRDIRLSPKVLMAGDDAQARAYLAGTQVEAVMSREALSVGPRAPLPALVDAFTQWRFSALPVVDRDDVLVGIISYVDVLEAQAQLVKGRQPRRRARE